MKRLAKYACLVLALMLAMPVSGALAGAEFANFTHPEVGEFMTITILDGAANFEIYGFTYYSIVDPARPYRGMAVNQLQLLNDRNVGFEESMQLMLDTVEGKEGYPALSLFEARGEALPYNEQLKALGREEKIKALRILNGFDGPEGFEALRSIPGFEKADVDALAERYIDYDVTIDGVRYPYRAQVFYFEEEGDWYQCYNEKYGYVKVDGQWKLIRITKEYADQYKQRTPYIHGVSGSMPEMLLETNDEAMRGTVFGMQLGEAESILGVSAADGGITLTDEKLYRLPAKARFSFENEQLSQVEYTFDNVQSFYSAFISLYIRYFDPVTLDEDGNMTWCQNDMTVSLRFDTEAPTLTFTPAE